MKYLTTILCLSILTINLSAQKEADEVKYKISAAQKMEYEMLAEAFAINIDTTVTLTKEDRKLAYEAKLNVLMKSHMYEVQEAELKAKLKVLRLKKNEIKQAGNDAVAVLLVTTAEKLMLAKMWKKEDRFLRKYKATKRKKARLEKLQKEKDLLESDK